MNTLEVKGVNKSYGKMHILHDISFSVAEHEIVGFIGPNGAGKTTTLKSVVNLIWPDSGTVEIGGIDIYRHREKALRQVSAIIENPGLFVPLTGLENMQFICSMRKVSKHKLEECIELSGLGKWIRQPVRKYSLGMKQRLAISMCILTSPQLLILDEPTNGLDPSGVIELREMLQRLSRELGTSILFSSHALGEVAKIAQRILYIKSGRLISQADKEMIDIPEYVFYVSNPDAAMRVMRESNLCKQLTPLPDGCIQALMPKEHFAGLNELLMREGIDLLDVEKHENDIETVYNRVFRDAEVS